jgi:type IV secretory pathway TrbD component
MGVMDSPWLHGIFGRGSNRIRSGILLAIVGACALAASLLYRDWVLVPTGLAFFAIGAGLAWWGYRKSPAMRHYRR